MKDQTTLRKMHDQQLKWFKDRIGKTIYRGAVSCDCDSCNRIEKEGLVIMDEMHADVLNAYSAETQTKYYDNKPTTS